MGEFHDIYILLIDKLCRFFFLRKICKNCGFFLRMIDQFLVIFLIIDCGILNFPCNDKQILEQLLATDWRKSCIFLRNWLTNFAYFYKRPIDEFHDIFFLLIGNPFFFLRTIGKNQFWSATSRLILRFTHDRSTNSTIFSLCQKTVPFFKLIGKITGYIFPRPIDGDPMMNFEFSFTCDWIKKSYFSCTNRQIF